MREVIPAGSDPAGLVSLGEGKHSGDVRVEERGREARAGGSRLWAEERGPRRNQPCLHRTLGL